VLHLLYARFWHKVLFDLGLVSTPEPFQRLFNQGKVHARSFRDASGRYYYPEEVEERDGEWFARADGARLETRVEKMSKTRYNVVRPEPLVEEYGADSLRLYELFMGPVEGNVVWQTEGISGTRRFLDRAWRLFEASTNSDFVDDEATERLLHRTIAKVTTDLDALSLNTAVSQLMIFVNHALPTGGVSRDALSRFVRVLAPFAPHAAEEMWDALGGEGLVAHAPWPDYDPALCEEATATVVVQVNGRLRARIELSAPDDERAAREAALAHPAVRPWVEGHEVARIVFVPGKLLNLVVE